MPKKRYYGRPSRTRPDRQRPSRTSGDYSKPRIEPALQSVFDQIGVPEPVPFSPDPFQIQALEKLEDHDVLVCAPTGAGKTWIALQAIHACLKKNMRIWYASPLKALSNSIYKQLVDEFGSQDCGILTGDRKENADAPVMIGTTEILRNQLYDSMHHGSDLKADLVILDEAHYLSDPDRGVVWEEVMIYLPSRVKLLLLSATISNADDVCAWLKEIRGSQSAVVRAEIRPVPLEMLFLFPDGLISPLGGKKGLFSKVKKYLMDNRMQRRGRRDQVDFSRMVHCLKKLDLLPAIFFLKSRADCDRALDTFRKSSKASDNSILKNKLKVFIEKYPHLENHRQIPSLVNSRVASHHGGQLPYWKVLVEEMMSQGFLDAIFSTSTVAAGVNFPARTVAILQSDRFNGREFTDLTATEFHQMVGRAGRRGKDNIGFGLVVPAAYQDPKLIHQLTEAAPEPIMSQIHINFSMTLNLLLSHTPQEVERLVERSFASFQESRWDIDQKKRWDRMVKELLADLDKSNCDASDPYEVMELIDKRRDLKKLTQKTRRSVQYHKSSEMIRKALAPGRLFLHKNGNVYVTIQVVSDQGRILCLSHNVHKPAYHKKFKFRPRRIDINQIQAVLNFQIPMPEKIIPMELDRLLADISLEEVLQTGVENSSGTDLYESEPVSEVDDLNQQIIEMPCETCPHLKVCHGGAKSRFRKRLRDFNELAQSLAGTGGGLWLSFKRHLRFLKETGFVNENDRLTADGFWASRLRLDQPLLIAEVIRNHLFDQVLPENLAGGLAPFVWDRTQEVELKSRGLFDLTDLERMFEGILNNIEKIRSLKNKRGFSDPVIYFWPCAALYLWAKGVPWDQLLKYTGIDEGDMASLVMRTADHLRQVANLDETHPELAKTAESAIELIMREPVFID